MPYIRIPARPADDHVRVDELSEGVGAPTVAQVGHQAEGDGPYEDKTPSGFTISLSTFHRE